MPINKILLFVHPTTNPRVMNTILYHIAVPSRSNLPAMLSPSTFRSNLRVILILAVTTLASTIPVHAGQLEAGLSRVVDSSCSADKFLMRPGVRALNWLADLGLDGTWKQPPAGSAQQLQVAAVFRQMPLSFEANVGQSDARVSFLARGPDYTLFLTASAE